MVEPKVVTVDERREFRDALLEAFQTEDDLASMVQFYLGQNLAAITKPASLKVRIEELITWAVARSKFATLVEAARLANPDSLDLARFAEKFAQRPAEGSSVTAVPSYDFRNVRTLIGAALGDSELQDLCFDYYPQVYEQFTAGQSKGDRVRMLLEHARRNNRVEELLARIQEANPNKYAELEPLLRTSS
ncbi:MAG: effector-associated domain EAD1-containing protein [Chloroflexota bacterium]|nr:effector-associated domain EAD1-containing protein [Chloroflexota bacterium]